MVCPIAFARLLPDQPQAVYVLGDSRAHRLHQKAGKAAVGIVGVGRSYAIGKAGSARILRVISIRTPARRGQSVERIVGKAHSVSGKHISVRVKADRSAVKGRKAVVRAVGIGRTHEVPRRVVAKAFRGEGIIL